MAQDDLAPLAIADGLYALAPEGFTQARDEQAAKARGAGQPDVAKLIKAWRRPKSSAWLLNMLVRERGDQLSQLFELDAALREAQQGGSGEQLRALSRQRRDTVNGLVFEARRLADSSGHAISESVVREVETTLQAALADPRAADAVLTGRLVMGLSPNGFDPVNLDGAVVLWTEPDSIRSTQGHPRSEQKRSGAASGVAPSRLEDARAAVRDAAADTASAQQELSTAEKALRSAAGRVDELRSRVTELEETLEEVSGALRDGEQDLRAAQSDHDAADRELQAARRRLAAAESQRNRPDP